MSETLTNRESLRSFLKWAGGKTRTAELIASLAPSGGFNRYFEPFCGSAAVFFALRPTDALLSDANTELIVCLQQVATAPDAVMRQLDEWPNTRDFYNEIRRWDPHSLNDRTIRAARVIYLNKTGFRGLWRVNRQGQFNTPYGQYNRPYYNRDVLVSAAAELRGAAIVNDDFRDVLMEAGPGDWVYADPPYVPDRAWGDFTRYTAGQFGAKDQEDLAKVLRHLDENGVRWLLTNSNTDKIRELYSGYRVHAVATRRDVALRASERSSIDLVVTNYDPPKREQLMPLE